MNLYPHDHILRYRFDSEARPDIAHVVDLGAFGGFGECSCEDFVFRIRPELCSNRHGNTPSYDVTDESKLRRCKHLIAAREHLLNQVIARVCDGENGL